MQFFLYFLWPVLVLYVVARHPRALIALWMGQFGGVARLLMVVAVAWTVFLAGLLALGLWLGGESRGWW